MSCPTYGILVYIWIEYCTVTMSTSPNYSEDAYLEKVFGC